MSGHPGTDEGLEPPPGAPPNPGPDDRRLGPASLAGRSALTRPAPSSAGAAAHASLPAVVVPVDPVDVAEPADLPPGAPEPATRPVSAPDAAGIATIHGLRDLPGPARSLGPRAGSGAVQTRSRSAGRASVATTARTIALTAPEEGGSGEPPGLALAAAVVPPERPPDPDENARPPRQPRPIRGRLSVGPLGVGQILCVQAAALAVLSRLGRDSWATWLVDSAAALLVVLALTPVRSGWLYQYLMRLVAFVSRRHTLDVKAALQDPALLPGLGLSDSVISTLDLDDSDIGLVEHPRGVTVVLAADPGGWSDPEAGPRPQRSVADLLDGLPLSDHDLTVQMLVTEAPASNLTGEDTPLVASYHGLAEGRPAYRETWFAVQAPRTPECHADEDMAELLGGVLRGVRRRLAKERLPLRLLATDELTEVFRTTMRIDPSGDGNLTGHHASEEEAEEIRAECALCRQEAERRSGTARETLTEWRVPGGVQACFAVVSWPDPERTRFDTVIDRLVAASGTGTTLSLATRAATTADSGRELECSIRLWAEQSAHLAQAARRLTNTAAALGVGLERHDGEHLAHVADTLPFGGFLR